MFTLYYANENQFNLFNVANENVLCILNKNLLLHDSHNAY